MPAKLRLPSGKVLVIDDYVWSCDADPALADDLNFMKTSCEGSVNMAISPDPDLEEAERVRLHLGGDIFDHKKFMERVPGRIY